MCKSNNIDHHYELATGCTEHNECRSTSALSTTAQFDSAATAVSGCWGGSTGWLHSPPAHGRVVTAASYSTPLHLAISTAPTPCFPLEWPVSVADCNNATTRNVQAFVAADIRASRLVFITTAVVPGTLMIPGCSFYCPGTVPIRRRVPGRPGTWLPA